MNHGILAVALLALPACAPGQVDEVEEKDFDTLEIPVSIPKNKSITIAFDADAGFTAKLDQNGSAKASMTLKAAEGSETLAEASAHKKPELEFAPEQEGAFELTIKNEDRSKAINGTLVLSAGAAECSEAGYAEWLAAYLARLDDVGTTMDDSEQAVLDQLLTVRPCTTSEDSYGDWLEAYKEALEGTGSMVDDLEAVPLGYYVQAAPEASGDAIWATWFGWWAEVVDDAGRFLDDGDHIRLDWVDKARPEGAKTSSYVTFVEAFDSKLASLGSSLSEDDQTHLALFYEVQPEGKTATAYIKWLELYQDRLESAGRSVEDNEALILDAVLTVRACMKSTTTSTNEAYWTFLSEADGGVLDWATKASPVCAEPEPEADEADESSDVE